MSGPLILLFIWKWKCAEGHLLNSIQRLKLIIRTVLKFKMLLLSGLTLQRNLYFAFKYQILSGAGCSARCRNPGVAPPSHEVQLSRGRSTAPWYVAGPCESSGWAAQDTVSCCQSGLCRQNVVTHAGLCSGPQADAPLSWGKITQGEATEEKRWRWSLIWRSSRLHYQITDCISRGTTAFFPWKEHFSSVCSCLSLLMEGSSTQWILNPVKLHGSFLGDPPAATLQHLCAWSGLLLWPIPAWHDSHSLGSGQRVLLQIHSYVGGSSQPKTSGKQSRGTMQLIWAKRLEKQLQIVSEGNATVL